MSLKNKMMKKNSGGGIAFMDGREKGDLRDLYGEVVTIKDVGFIDGDDGKFAVLDIKEHPNHFFFGASVVSGHLLELDTEELEELRKEGLPVKFTEAKSKKNRRYQTVEFYPGEDLAFDSGDDDTVF